MFFSYLALITFHFNHIIDFIEILREKQWQFNIWFELELYHSSFRTLCVEFMKFPVENIAFNDNRILPCCNWKLKRLSIELYLYIYSEVYIFIFSQGSGCGCVSLKKRRLLPWALIEIAIKNNQNHFHGKGSSSKQQKDYWIAW